MSFGLGLEGLGLELFGLFQQAVYLSPGGGKIARTIESITLLALLGRRRQDAKGGRTDAVRTGAHHNDTSGQELVSVAMTAQSTGTRQPVRHDTKGSLVFGTQTLGGES